MSYSEREMEPKEKEHLKNERRRFHLDHENPHIQSLYQESLDFAKRMRGMTNKEVAEELTLKMVRVANTDQLTHLPNKQGLLIELNAVMETAKEFNLPLTVLHIDADHFKEINDAFGLDFGDLVIIATADGVKKGTGRWSDIEGRLIDEQESQDPDGSKKASRRGGDEFVVILLETDRAGAEIVAQRIEEQVTLTVRNRHPQVEEKLKRPFSVTVGIATYNPMIDKDAVSLLKRTNQDVTQKRLTRGETRRS